MDRKMQHESGSWAKISMSRMVGAMAAAGLVMGMVASPLALAGIANTKHNLGSTGVGTNNKFGGTAEICVFCHTPHGSVTSAAVPLWNRSLAAATTYTTYNSLGTSSLDGATAPVGSVSLACLSCHDGTQAMNVMINTPGSGTTYPTGLAGTWTGANQTAGALGAGVISNLGQDLKNDHPIGIQYGGGPTASGIPAVGTDYTVFRDADFQPAKSTTLNNQSVWWVDTTGGGAGTREKTDMQLYTRTDAASVSAAGVVTAGALTGAQPFVECASCHDPHSENATFLRISNASSAVCLACHIK